MEDPPLRQYQHHDQRWEATKKPAEVYKRNKALEYKNKYIINIESVQINETDHENENWNKLAKSIVYVYLRNSKREVYFQQKSWNSTKRKS